MTAVEIVTMLLVGGIALAVVLTKDPLKQVLVFSLFGSALA